jgi:hypothetical protein
MLSEWRRGADLRSDACSPVRHSPYSSSTPVVRFPHPAVLGETACSGTASPGAWEVSQQEQCERVERRSRQLWRPPPTARSQRGPPSSSRRQQHQHHHHHHHYRPNTLQSTSAVFDQAKWSDETDAHVRDCRSACGQPMEVLHPPWNSRARSPS